MTDRVLKPWLIVTLCVAVVLGVVAAVVAPRFIEWLVGGTIAGGLTLLKARSRSGKAQEEHKARSLARARAAAELNAEAAEAVAEASDAEPPPSDVPDDEAARRKRLEALGRWDD